MTTVAEIVAAVTTLGRAMDAIPGLDDAVLSLVRRARAKEDLTPAIKHAEVIAAEHFLGIVP